MIRQVIIPRGEVEAAGGRDAVEDPFAGDGVARPTVEGAQRGEMRSRRRGTRPPPRHSAGVAILPFLFRFRHPCLASQIENIRQRLSINDFFMA